MLTLKPSLTNQKMNVKMCPKEILLTAGISFLSQSKFNYYSLYLISIVYYHLYKILSVVGKRTLIK